MPKRTDLKKIMLIGSGPIIIGQAAEFDYSGSQACKALREEGYEVVLVNSNPATIMTDPEMADRVYIEPLTCDTVTKIIEKEKPDALLPTLGGQTALNLTIELGDKGILDKNNVELIGASLEAIRKAEDRELFKEAMESIGLECARSETVHDLKTSIDVAAKIGFPIVVRPAFTLGGTGGGIAYDNDELAEIVKKGLDLSMINQVLLEEGLVGWKEFEYEVMRDTADNVVIICTIENLDPMGIHTGDSITVAPAQTLTDKEYQMLRDASIKVIREIGVDTGGSNIQFAIHPENGRLIVIEMNPRVSRSSSLASKATGFPIAKIAAKLAVGYTLDEIPNDITGETPSSFEPTIDYVVTKAPRFAFKKFPQAKPTLTTQMKSVGESMSIGRTMEESLQKALRSLEIKRYGLCCDGKEKKPELTEIIEVLKSGRFDRIFHLYYAVREGMSVDEIAGYTKIDPWYIEKIKHIYEIKLKLEEAARTGGLESVDTMLLETAKRYGYSDMQLAHIFTKSLKDVRQDLKSRGISVVYKMVDTCAAEFSAKTPYYYSTYGSDTDYHDTGKKKVIVIGSGPNRIGQGIEFDYCCVHSVFSLRDQGYEAIMVNNNPETVSTDYDTSDRLYFEPITAEDVMNIYDSEKPEGVIVQFGGQTPLNIAEEIDALGAKILGTSHETINLVEDRELFNKIITELGIPQPPGATVFSVEDAADRAREIGYPVMLRPSFVLGGRGMQMVYDEKTLLEFAKSAVKVAPTHPMLVDKFLENALEVEVDAICDTKDVYIAAIMEHIEQAGIHSGDSACVIPSRSISEDNIKTLEDYTRSLALKLGVIGLINIQYAIYKDEVYILEANPRGSRTVPYVSKVIGIPIAKLATKVIMGQKLKDVIDLKRRVPPYYAVKEAVFSFNKFSQVDPVLGPEMKSTGEVMGIGPTFGVAYHKALEAAGNRLPDEGTVLFSIADRDKEKIIDVAQRMKAMGYDILATPGTYKFLHDHGIKCDLIEKSHDKEEIVRKLLDHEIQLVVNTPTSVTGRMSGILRRYLIRLKIPYITTCAAAYAMVEGLEAVKASEVGVKSLQEYYESL
ncbi:carbamoyl-phosphate synthase large subunit [Candidatus Altiarchaeota archaeon]